MEEDSISDPKKLFFSTDNLSTLSVYLSNKRCRLSLQAFKHIIHHFLCSISESGLVNNGMVWNSKKFFAFLCQTTPTPSVLQNKPDNLEPSNRWIYVMNNKKAQLLDFVINLVPPGIVINVYRPYFIVSLSWSFPTDTIIV